MSDHSIVDLMPSDTPRYMIDGWLGCVMWAIGEPEVVEQFRKETGNNWQPSRNGLEQMIDSATGSEWAFVEAFVKWVNERIWGPMDGPQEDEE